MKRDSPITSAEFKQLVKKQAAKAKSDAVSIRMRQLNDRFQTKLVALNIAYQTEYQFHPIRKWKADYFFPAANLALEIEGGAFTNGRHTRGKGFIADMEKYNAMTLQGIKLLRYTPDQLNQPTTINNILKLCKQN
jgi:very-short-patch-repair endonuclease